MAPRAWATLLVKSTSAELIMWLYFSAWALQKGGLQCRGGNRPPEPPWPSRALGRLRESLLAVAGRRGAPLGAEVVADGDRRGDGRRDLLQLPGIEIAERLARDLQLADFAYFHCSSPLDNRQMERKGDAPRRACRG